MEEKYEQLKEDVLDEIEEIEQVLKDLSSLNNNLVPDKIDNIQKAAIGAFLMNFYVGVENIVKRISKEYYQNMPKGESWHKELLDLSYNPPQGKSPVFDKKIVDRLNPYRGFRHLFVSGYGFKLRMELMTSLINNIELLWIDIKSAIERFWGKL
ncbi:MAG: ribonuclease toxin HepT-like protein [Candidatus Scalindua sp.]